MIAGINEHPLATARGQERSREEFKALQSCSFWKLGLNADAGWLHKMLNMEQVHAINMTVWIEWIDVMDNVLFLIAKPGLR